MTVLTESLPQVEDWLEQVAPPVTAHRLGRFLDEVAGRSDVAVDFVQDYRTETSGVLVRFGMSNLPDGEGRMTSLARSYYVVAADGHTSVIRVTRKTRSVASLTELVVFGRAWVAGASHFPNNSDPVVPVPRKAVHDR